MQLPVRAEARDLALDVQEYLTLFDLTRALEATRKLAGEGGEALRPCATAMEDALSQGDWAGAGTCLEQLLALVDEPEEGEE